MLWVRWYFFIVRLPKANGHLLAEIAGQQGGSKEPLGKVGSLGHLGCCPNFQSI
jgi:hypothetical protein